MYLYLLTRGYLYDKVATPCIFICLPGDTCRTKCQYHVSLSAYQGLPVGQSVNTMYLYLLTRSYLHDKVSIPCIFICLPGATCTTVSIPCIFICLPGATCRTKCQYHVSLSAYQGLPVGQSVNTMYLYLLTRGYL